MKIKNLDNMDLILKSPYFINNEIKINEDDYKTEIKDFVNFYAHILNNKYNKKIYEQIAKLIYYIINSNRRNYNEQKAHLIIETESKKLEKIFCNEGFVLTSEKIRKTIFLCFIKTPQDVNYKNFNLDVCYEY